MTTDEQNLQRQLADPQCCRAAFAEVVRLYSVQLYWKVRRMVLNHDDANDILQNVFIKAWNNLDEFHNKAKISTWLYRIAVNESLDFLRRQKKTAEISADEEPTVAAQLLADDFFDGDHTEALLQEAIAQLPDVQRVVFNLRYFDEMKYSDISKMLNTSEGALKASYHIAVKKITAYLHDRD